MPSTSTARKEVYVFDSAVPDIQKLIDAIGADQSIIILNAGSDGVLQLASALASYSNLDAIHLFSHGSVGSLYLGSTVLNSTNLPSYSEAMAQIGGALNGNGDILLYGCDVALGDLGQRFIVQLAGLTGADVAASVDLTGSAVLGGDWILENTTGLIETIANNASSYTGLLVDMVAHQPNYDINLALTSARLSQAA